VGCNHLGGQHALCLVARADPSKGGDSGGLELVLTVLVEALQPQGVQDVVSQHVVEGVGLRATDVFELALASGRVLDRQASLGCLRFHCCSPHAAASCGLG
jgi:hypothetical protein